MFTGITLDNEFSEKLKAAWDPGLFYLVAVSGGRDSMALLCFLHEAGFKNLLVCHINHGLRGESSDADERLVREEAGRLGYEAVIRQVDIAGFVRAAKLSIEAAARILRYRAFAEISREKDCRRIFLAHHADDRIETVLINLFRGTGARGLAGIEAETTRVIDGVELELIRPFLVVSRETIDDYISAKGVRFRDDESNTSDFALRNRIRNRLLPMLNEIFERDVRSAVLRAADLSALEDEWAVAAMGELPRKGEGGGLDVTIMRGLPAARRNRLLLFWLRESGVPDCGLSEVERAVAVLFSTASPSRASLPGGFHVRRREGILFIEPPGLPKEPV